LSCKQIAALFVGWILLNTLICSIGSWGEYMRKFCAVLALLHITTAGWCAPQAASAPYEIVKDHTEIEVASDGTGVSSREQVIRVLNERGIELLHEQRFGVARFYEDVHVVAAYTLKANGGKIVVPKSGILTGFGQTSTPGFQDNAIVSIFFPNLEVGDSIVLLTVRQQTQPWFEGRFDYREDYSRRIPAHDVIVSITSSAAQHLTFETLGLTALEPRAMGSKIRRSWSYSNDAVEPAEADSVDESDDGPRLVATTFSDYAEVARAYSKRSQNASDVTPEIKILANKITDGLIGHREQVKALYEWVASHIAYVQIVLGEGGFSPHLAKDVLSNRYGDCKDHVVLLEALLKAKGIASAPILLRSGAPAYELSTAASPHAFDHVITFVPELNLYLDSTSQFSPFAVLPYSDQGKLGLNVMNGAVARIPVTKADASSIKSVGEIRIGNDGAVDGQVTITAMGSLGSDARYLVRSIPPGGEQKFISDRVGLGAEGVLERGNPADLSEPYVFKAKYHVPGAVVLPGPGALSPSLLLRFFSLGNLLAYDLPASRRHNFVCPTLSSSTEVRYVFPEGTKLLSIPTSQVLEGGGARLQIDYDRVASKTLTQKLSLRLSHDSAICSPADYAKLRPTLAKMLAALKEEILYRGPKGSDK
jgi:transglutaminase-like putative cysteine protease